MGAEGVRALLRAIDLKREIETLRKDLEEDLVGRQDQEARQAPQGLEGFENSNIKPDWMVMEVIPVCRRSSTWSAGSRLLCDV